MTGLDIILRFERCSLNVHNRLSFSIKKVIFCTVVDVVKSKKKRSLLYIIDVIKSKKNVIKSTLTTFKNVVFCS